MSWSWKKALHLLRRGINKGEATAEELLDFYVQLADHDTNWGAAMQPLVERAYAEGIVPRELIAEIGHYTTAPFAQARQVDPPYGVTWYLPKNPIWNLPLSALRLGELRGEPRYSPGPFASWVGFRALAVDSRMRRVFGLRELQGAHESRHPLEGRVKIGAEAFRAFTSSQMFELPGHRRADARARRLVDVATLHVCFADWPWPSHGYGPSYEDPDHPLPRL